MSKVVVSFGELLWDLLPGGAELGGAPSNFGYRMNTFGHEAIIVSRVGDDELGRSALEMLRSKGLNTEYIQVDSRHPTGTVDVNVSASGEPDFKIVPNVAYDFIEFTPALEKLAAGADCVCFGTLIQRSEGSRVALYRFLDAARSAKKVLDLNLRRNCYNTETIKESLRRADILKLNESELIELASLLQIESVDPIANLNDQVAFFAQMIAGKFDLEVCIVTRGGEGSLALKFAHADEGSRHTHTTTIVPHPAYLVTVQDTCGSGDAFTAAFIHQYLDGKGIEVCSAYGNALGALVAQRRGGMAPVTKNEIEEMIAKRDLRG